jgi:hypothetical protein
MDQRSRWVAALLIAVSTAACDSSVGPDESHPRDPRGTYMAVSWNERTFPFLLREPAVLVMGQWHEAEHHVTGVRLVIGSHFAVGVTGFYVLKASGDTIRGLGSGGEYGRGTWQYDRRDGEFLFLTEPAAHVELREGEFERGVLHTRGVVHLQGAQGAVQLQFEPLAP